MSELCSSADDDEDCEIVIDSRHTQYYHSHGGGVYNQERGREYDEFDEAMPQIKNGDLYVDSVMDLDGEDEDEPIVEFL